MNNSLGLMQKFKTNGGLLRKISEEGRILPFYGDTIIFTLEKSVITKIKEYQDILYQSSGDMLADTIDNSTFHITLHDLCNGTNIESLREREKRNKELSDTILNEFFLEEQRFIVLRPVSVFNMVKKFSD